MTTHNGGQQAIDPKLINKSTASISETRMLIQQARICVSNAEDQMLKLSDLLDHLKPQSSKAVTK